MTQEKAIETLVGNLADTAKKALEGTRADGEFMPLVVFLINAGSKFISFPVPESARIFEPELKPHARGIIKAIYNDLRSRWPELNGIVAVVAISDCRFNTFIGKDKSDTDAVEKAYKAGTLKKPLQHPQATDALLVAVSTKEKNEAHIYPYERVAGRITYLPQTDTYESDTMGGHIANLFPL